MISRIEVLGSGSLLELASLHDIHLDANTSERDMLRDVIIRHLISGECRDTNATLCVSVRSVLSSWMTLGSRSSQVLFVVMYSGGLAGCGLFWSGCSQLQIFG